MVSHASVPFAEPLGGDLYRVFFTSRDADNRSFIGWLDFDITRPHEILRVAETPVIGPGRPGAFDDRGAMMSWITTHGRRRHLYYIGWNVRSPMPFHVSIGLATGNAADPPEAVTPLDGPVLERSPVDPLFCSNPCVLHESGLWHMWYLSGLGWEMVGGRPSASYDIRHAVSDDGIDWRRDGRPAVGLAGGDQLAIARPCVVRDGAGWAMWYCARTRSHPYRLGVARSSDLVHWERDDASAGLDPAADGWDSEMVAYPHVFRHRGTRHMLYCGNGFGRTGFGLAVED